ncbi:hypothetical protein MRB53_037590 [Persea americana]|nr:hypothetical protein MRB53_037590 [Persea americana]
MPVPKSRDDFAYFAPLQNLVLPPSAELFLGLVHGNDTLGTLSRVQTARSALDRPFGVATECGLGRTSPDEIDSIIEIMCTVSEPYHR